jgi:hypothetical protein
MNVIVQAIKIRCGALGTDALTFREVTVTLSKTLILCAFVVLVGSGATIAQPSPIPKAVAETSDGKKAVSKACSDQANAQGLHGKKRKAFRYNCKKHGGKSA